MEEQEILREDVEKLIGHEVEVVTRDGRRFRGKLIQYDEQINLLLEEATDVATGARHKLIFFKGGNILEVLLLD